MSGELVHLALIMDGNGRWATAKGLERTAGHKEGGKAAVKVMKGCIENGIKYLTLYCFSTENWKRPKGEVDYLMGLFSNEIVNQIPAANKYGIRILHLGSRDRLPVDALSGIDQAIEATKNNNTLTVQLALDYGGHNEIDRAIQKAVAAGEKEFSESTLSKYFDNPFVPSPDYICRSAGEKRLSGFMLYQSNYAELGFYDKLWPDWDESMVNLIVDDFHKRIRKFGEVK